VDNHHCIFLTQKETLDAIAMDFKQYGNQLPLFYKLSPLILGIQTSVKPEGKNAGVWIPSDGHNRMKKIADGELGDALLAALASKPYPLPLLSEICRLVFQVHAFTAKTGNGSQPGIWIQSDMNRFVCGQCGDCCRSLDYKDECTKEDYTRWQKLERYDILDRVMVIQRKDGQNEYRIWVEPGTDNLYETCPWLGKMPNGDQYRCRIQDVKPVICREYPFTRKHAIMTGCNGEFKARKFRGS
jgi:Fe-S-cluster containining protein